MYEKVIQSGNEIEIYTYEKTPAGGGGKRKVERHTYSHGKCLACGKLAPLPRPRSLRSAKRAKVQFRRMVRASLALGTPAFVTLTMVDVADIGESYKAFSSFGAGLRKRFGTGVAWIAVPEYQERGAVHFHALVWGLPKEIIFNEAPFESYFGSRRVRALINFINFCDQNGFTPSQALGSRDLQTIWWRGWCDISPSDGSPKLAGYLAKYMQKTMLDDRVGGRKAYLASRNTLRPVRTSSALQIAFIKKQILRPHRRKSKRVGVDKYSLQREITYDTLWLGRCHYQKFAKEIIV